MKAAAVFLFILSFFCSCRQGGKHPQADLINKNATEGLTAQEIITYADSVDAGANSMEKSESLIYQTGASSFRVEEYFFQGKPIILVKFLSNEGVSGNSEKYYFKDDSLILIKQNSKKMEDRSVVFVNKRIYIRKNIPFMEEMRTAPSYTLVNSLPFAEIKNGGLLTTNYQDSVQILNDALAGRNSFEMVFDQFIPGKDLSTILLKSKIPGGYSASLNVNQKDGFIDSLTKDPSLFRDQKLHLKWKIDNNEVSYVPVNVTSASGLNK